MSARCLHSVLVCGLAFLSTLKGHAQFVTLEGRQFMLDGQEFYPVVVNYGTEFVANQLNQNEPEEIHYSPMHQLDRIPQQHFECTNPAQCDLQLRAHFNQIVGMGFNSIRLVGASPESFRTSSGSRLYKLKVKDINPWGNAYYVNLSTSAPAFSDPMSDRYFHLVERILDAADDAGLKVILLTGTDVKTWPITEDPIIYDWEGAVLYAELLRKLAWHLRDHPALLAYDLINEPAWHYTNPNLTRDMSKADVCAMTSLWYDAIAEMDPNHLVTIGGAGKHDIGSWDPAVMKIDFYSPHPYLEDDWAFANIHDMPAAMGMYMAELYWFAASTEMPWLVGETSFSANDDDTDYNNDPNFICLDGAPEHHAMPYMNGNESEQAAFVGNALAATRAYRGSGFAWWYFQDGRSHPYQTATPAQVRNNYLGALSYGDGTLSWREKPMVGVVQAYQPEPLPVELPEPPPAYWNWHALPSNVYRTYHLQDQNQEPIANGIALVKWKYQSLMPPVENAFIWARSVSNNQGELRIQLPRALENEGYITPLEAVEIKVDVPGAARQESPPIWPNEDILPFNRQLLPFARTLSDLEIVSEDGRSHSAWAELTVQDGVVHASGAENDLVVFEARHWVRALGEFHIGNGSEAQLRTAKTFPDCSYSNWGMAPESTGPAIPAKTRIVRKDAEINLRFKPVVRYIKAYPNPCSDVLVIHSSTIGQMEVRDAMGRLVFSELMQTERMVLDSRQWAPGLYALTLKHQEGTETLRILKAQ